MTGLWASLLPVVALLVVLGLLAWAVQWLRRRTQMAGGDIAALRVISQLAVGPQQRVVVVELNGPSGTVLLTLGVTPQHVRTLHLQPLDGAQQSAAFSQASLTSTANAADTAGYADIARSSASHEPQRQEPIA